MIDEVQCGASKRAASGLQSQALSENQCRFVQCRRDLVL